MSCGERLRHRQMADLVAIAPAPRPPVDLLEAHQHLGEGRLAAARLADDRHRFRLAGFEVELLIGLDEARSLAETACAANELSRIS